MKKNLQSYNHDEIDLVNLSKVIWINKIKLLFITMVFLLVGFIYTYQKPNIFQITLVLEPNNEDFVELLAIDKILKQEQIKNNNFNQLIETNFSNKSNYSREEILNKFINELKDYDEFIENLKQTRKINDEIVNLTPNEQKKILFKYAKLLEVNEYNKNKEDYILNFSWTNSEEAKEILDKTIKLAYENLKNSIIENFETQLKWKLKKITHQDSRRRDYLIEQSLIAKELGLKENQINSFSSKFNINSANVAYYLRGFKAIDKEIELINDRKYNDLELIRQEINDLRKKNIEWINYNFF